MRSAAVNELLDKAVGARVVRERVTFNAPGGRRLSGELAYPESGMVAFAASIVGPHPYMGGTMANPLVVAMGSKLVDRRGVVLRFDYGGTGQSQGRPIDVAQSMSVFWRTDHAPEDPGRIDDVSAAAEYLASLGVERLVVVGYSFGCYAALRGWPATNPSAVVLVSPTVGRHDFSRLGGWGVPMLVIHSDNDFATPPEAVREWFETACQPKQRLCIEGGEHFFRGLESNVAEICAEFVVCSLGKFACMRGTR